MINERYKTPIIFITTIVIALLAYGVLTMRDQRSLSQRVSDAVEKLPQGPDKAARELEDRTPGQKLGDVVKDAGDKIKEGTRPSDNR